MCTHCSEGHPLSKRSTLHSLLAFKHTITAPAALPSACNPTRRRFHPRLFTNQRGRGLGCVSPATTASSSFSALKRPPGSATYGYAGAGSRAGSRTAGPPCRSCSAYHRIAPTSCCSSSHCTADSTRSRSRAAALAAPPTGCTTQDQPAAGLGGLTMPECCARSGASCRAVAGQGRAADSKQQANHRQGS